MIAGISAVTLCGWIFMGAGAPPAAKVSLGDGTIYVAAYSGSILAIDEATEKVAAIPLKTGFPFSVQVSSDAANLYALNADMERMEVIDIGKRQSVDTFTLSEPGKKVRIRGYAIDPLHHVMALGIQTVKKLSDRFEIGPYELALYDLAAHKIIKTLVEPGGRPNPRFNVRFSPDGKLLYMFGRDILILDASTLEQIDTWDLSLPIEPGMGSGALGSQEDAYQDPTYFTALFTIQDPVANRRIVGVGRINLSKRTVDFAPLGPAPDDLRLSFAVSPDHKRGYILAQAVDDYQLWLVDIDKRRVEKKIPFEGRPRMAIQVSTSGQVLYIYEAGRTIDLYDVSDFKHLRTITMETDMPYNSFHVVPSRRRASSSGR